jgi:hypothetical protein
METKRCPRCNKLLRVDSQSCSRCGFAFATRRAKKQTTVSGDTDFLPSQATNPLASPHRAGHYSGLHPEDQPFQSSFFLRVQQRTDGERVETLPAPEFEPESEPDESSWSGMSQEPERDEAQTLLSEFAEAPTNYPAFPSSLPETPLPTEPRRPKQSIRFVPVLASAALIFFLVATSLLVYLLLGRGPVSQASIQITAIPGVLRVDDTLALSGRGFHAHSQISVTRDAQVIILDAQRRPVQTLTNDQGAFQMHIPILASWSIGVHQLHVVDTASSQASTSITIQPSPAGPPHLQLSLLHADLGAGDSGTLTQKSLVLSNSGGGKISWQAKSSAAWLTLNPASGSFAGSATAVVSVKRSNLTPQAYLGQILFTQNQGASQILYISMAVNTAPANLALTPNALSFSGTPTESPANQTLIIQNSGGQALDWTAGSTTSNGVNWLSVTPASGSLAAGTSAILTVNVNTIQMAEGNYQGAFSFSYGSNAAQQVAIDLAVGLASPTATPPPTVTPVPVPALHVTPQSLTFATNQGSDPAPRSFTVANTGGATLNLAVQEDANAQTYLEIAPLNGSLAPGQSINVTVSPQLGSASGSINSILTVVDSDQGSTVVSQQVKTAIAITSEPVITLITGNMQFLQDSISTDAVQVLMFSNTGNLPLDWSMSASSHVPWLTFSASSGTLTNSGDTAYINVECNSLNIKPQTYTVTLTIKDTDAETAVVPQTFTITVTISS